MKTSIGILSALILSLGLNSYFYMERQEIQTNLTNLNQSLTQKQELLKLASLQPEVKTTTTGHRLALPSNRISIGDDFQHLSRTLMLQRLDFQILPETTIDDALSESTVELKFVNNSDFPLFRMMGHIIDEFPGLVHPLEIVMWRETKDNGPLIHGRFRFNWLKSDSEKVDS